MKCHRVKCRSVRFVEKSTIRDVTNGIITNLSSSTVQLNDELGGSQWHVNPGESHQNERDLEVV